MISNGRFRCTRALNASTASDPFSAISTVCPYFSRILTANFWLTRLSSASRMSNITSFVAAAGLTVLDSRAEMSADARSWALTGVVTSELMLLSKHHFTKRGRVNGQLVNQRWSSDGHRYVQFKRGRSCTPVSVGLGRGHTRSAPVPTTRWGCTANAHTRGSSRSVVAGS
jgi:hypothetical protein